MFTRSILPLFFLALLHPFRRREIADVRVIIHAIQGKHLRLVADGVVFQVGIKVKAIRIRPQLPLPLQHEIALTQRGDGLIAQLRQGVAGRYRQVQRPADGGQAVEALAGWPIAV